MSKKVAQIELSICKIDLKGVTKGSGMVIQFDKATAVELGLGDEVYLISLDSVISIDALKDGSVKAHFRDTKGSGCATFAVHQSTLSNIESILLTERFPSNDLLANIILLPQSQLQYTGFSRVFHRLGIQTSLHRRAQPATDYSANRNVVPGQQSSSHIDSKAKEETFLCRVVLDSGNQPKSTVCWRSYELFRDLNEQRFYLQKQGKRLSAKIRDIKDFVGDEAPEGAVILNQNIYRVVFSI